MTAYFRRVGLLEAASFLILLGIAMPLKYLYHQPMAVTVVGSLHGILFLLYCHAAVMLGLRQKWSKSKLALALVASVLPGGPIWFDRKML